MDEKIKKRCGKDNPFTTPEGYFDTLNERIMASVDNAMQEEQPEQRDRKVVALPVRKHSWTSWLTGAVAACAAVVLVFNLNTTDNNTPDDLAANDDMVIYDDDYRTDALNYALVDNEDVFYYLSGTEF